MAPTALPSTLPRSCSFVALRRRSQRRRTASIEHTRDSPQVEASINPVLLSRRTSDSSTPVDSPRVTGRRLRTCSDANDRICRNRSKCISDPFRDLLSHHTRTPYRCCCFCLSLPPASQCRDHRTATSWPLDSRCDCSAVWGELRSRYYYRRRGRTHLLPAAMTALESSFPLPSALSLPDHSLSSTRTFSCDSTAKTGARTVYRSTDRRTCPDFRPHRRF